jgi:LAS superfamily LD-carboxypeptidase LdcB
VISRPAVRRARVRSTAALVLLLSGCSVDGELYRATPVDSVVAPDAGDLPPACVEGEARACGDEASCAGLVEQTCTRGVWGACAYVGAPPDVPCTTTCEGGDLDGTSLLVPVSKVDALREDATPADLRTLPSAYRIAGLPDQLRTMAMGHFVQLADAAYVALGAGTGDTYCSGYRSFAAQCSLFASYAETYGCEDANTFSMLAGHSEHQLGTVCDVEYASGAFIQAGEPVAEFYRAHAHEYGFVMSYPEGTTALTGIEHEPWHFRYVGAAAAAAHAELERTLGRVVSLHEFLALARCASADQLPGWEAESAADAARARAELCQRGMTDLCGS